MKTNVTQTYNAVLNFTKTRIAMNPEMDKMAVIKFTAEYRSDSKFEFIKLVNRLRRDIIGSVVYPLVSDRVKEEDEIFWQEYDAKAIKFREEAVKLLEELKELGITL